MANITAKQRMILEKFLEMGSGYVLDFSDRTFAAFFNDEMNIDVTQEKYYSWGTSKANRMRAFWEAESNETVSTLILKLIEYYKDAIIMNGESLDDAQKALIEKISTIAQEIAGQNTTAIHNVEEYNFLQKEFKDIKIENLPIELSMRNILEDRLNEINICITNGANLGAIFLIGSTLEGVLLGLAENEPEKFNRCAIAPKDTDGKVLNFKSWTLANFIDVTNNLGLLREDVKKFSHSLRDFRNYIHPKQQQIEKFNPDKRTAAICQHVLLAAIENLQELNSPKIP